MTKKKRNNSLFAIAFRKFCQDKLAFSSLIIVTFLIFLAIYAPFFVNSYPLLWIKNHNWSLPFLKEFFNPSSPEVLIECCFNYIALLLPAVLIFMLLFKKRLFRLFFILSTAVLLVLPFCLTKPPAKGIDWRAEYQNKQQNITALFALVQYSPSEQASRPFLKPDNKHFFGTDYIGRDVLARMIFGTRVSIFVGIVATAIAIIIGTAVGIICGYYGGIIDLIIMRLVEVIICFPTFLLLLILMVIFLDMNFTQSILIVIGIIGLTSWTGLSRLVRGETLKTRSMEYIQSCEASGIHPFKIMAIHILPNVTAPIIIAFTFGVAGAVLAESGLSFLGFGVQPPTSSWGQLLRQASDDPFNNWHLTLWPGLALFVVVCAFNFIGEGLRKVLDPK